MGKYVYILALVLASWVLFGNNAMSNTPDGETPAVEDVCEFEVGAAYGLCVSYCEATDCADGVQQANPEACERVRENYRNITGNADFPCDCPCKYSLVPATAECLGTVYNETLELSLINSKEEVMSSIEGTDATADEMMYQDVVVRDPDGKSSCAVKISSTDKDNPCVKEAIEQQPKEGMVVLNSPTVINACQTSFAQYAQDAIFKASQREVIKIELQEAVK